jgi:non-specific serine/threonine protein kinase
VAYRAVLRGDYARARALYTQCEKAAQEVEDTYALALGHLDLAVLAQYEGDYEQARREFDDGLRQIREIGDEFATAVAESQVAWHAWWRGDLDAAAHRSVQEDSMARLEQMGRKGALSWVKCSLAWVVHAQGENHVAGTLFRESLAAPSHRRGDELILWCVEGLARVWVSQGQMERAARLLGACEAVRRVFGFVPPPQLHREQEQVAGTVRAALGDAAFNALHAEGKNMTPEQAVAYAREQNV